jgi:hypothetical protein
MQHSRIKPLAIFLEDPAISCTTNLNIAKAPQLLFLLGFFFLSKVLAMEQIVFQSNGTWRVEGVI